MVLFNFMLGIFCFTAIFVMWAFSFFYAIEVMRGVKQLSSVQVFSRLLFSALSTLGLMASVITLRGGVTGLSAFIGLGTIPLMSISAILLMGSILYLLYSFYKNKKGTMSFWKKIKNAVDGFFSLFDSSKSSDSAIQIFEKKLLGISSNVREFNNEYQDSVSQLIGLRNNMTVSEAVDASGRWKSQSKELDTEIPVLKQIIAAITFAGDPQTPAISFSEIRERAQSREAPLKSVTMDEFTDVLSRFFKLGNTSYVISPVKEYIVKSVNGSILEEYLGDFAENPSHNYLECKGLFRFDGQALDYFIKNTQAIPMINIEIFSKPDKVFTKGENVSIEGTKVDLTKIKQQVDVRKLMEDRGRQPQSSSETRMPLNLTMPRS